MYTDLFKTPVEQRAEWLKEVWLKKKGYPLDVDNPKIFTEKIQWYKTYYRHPDLHRIIDKVEFKQWVAEQNLPEAHDRALTAKLIRVWNSPEEVSFEGLPRQCVIKSNCRDNGQWIAVVKDWKHYDVESLEKEIKTEWFDIQKTLINSFCTGYHKMTPKVFVEEYLDYGDIVPEEFKFFCFNGEPLMVYTTKEHFKDKEGNIMNDISDYPFSFYDLNWKKMDIVYGNHPEYPDAPRPVHFEEMIDISRRLSASFPFVRVDFFETPLQPYLAELTFYPGGGWTPFHPASVDTWMGDLFQVPLRSNIDIICRKETVL